VKISEIRVGFCSEQTDLYKLLWENTLSKDTEIINKLNVEVMTKLQLYANERVHRIPIKKSVKGFSYAITDYGRAIQYLTKPEEGVFLKAGAIEGYPSLAIRLKGFRKTYLIHRLVAEYFLKRPSPHHKFVIHLNHKKDDNYVYNLKWATAKEQQDHAIKNRMKKELGSYKLTEERVRLIKRKMLNGKTRLKIIAKQFGVSDMQIHRIKTGENWGHVKI